MNQLYQIPVVADVFRHLQVKDRVHLGRCDKRLYRLIQNALFWTDVKTNILPEVVECGNLWLTSVLLQLQITDNILKAALNTAIRMQFHEIMCLILDHGADFRFNNDVILRQATSRGDVNTVRLLLDYGADIHAQNDEPLRWTALGNYVKTARLLLDRGADIHAKDDDALRRAAAEGCLEMVRLLLDHGANIHASNDDALCSAVRRGHLEIVRLLLDHGADINCLSKQKRKAIIRKLKMRI